MRNFRELQIWQEGMKITDMVFSLVTNFPKSELYGLASQLSRASVSIPSNIAEGCSRSSEKDFKRFLEIAQGSAFEVETQLEIAKRRNYISKEELTEILADLHVLQRKINSFRTSIINRM